MPLTVAFPLVPDMILPEDVSAGDVIALGDAQEDLVVTAVRLGNGGFLLTVVPLAGEPEGERLVTLTPWTPLRKRGVRHSGHQPV